MLRDQNASVHYWFLRMKTILCLFVLFAVSSALTLQVRFNFFAWPNSFWIDMFQTCEQKNVMLKNALVQLSKGHREKVEGLWFLILERKIHFQLFNFRRMPRMLGWYRQSCRWLSFDWSRWMETMRWRCPRCCQSLHWLCLPSYWRCL